MKERQIRQKMVQKLVKTHKIKSQEELLGYLQREGFLVTQATLSRDLKTLKVGKVSDGQGAYIYFLPGEEAREIEGAYIQDFLKGYISIEWSGNTVIVKTYSGHSDPVSLALDNLNFEEVLGTIAGRDNTVAVFLRQGVSGEDFMKRLKQSIPELDT
ncbi:MAG: ArgR family transcriptional regulator [Treponema sp.]|nr:ArgR family transcriptional regulator [Treponema sp.]